MGLRFAKSAIAMAALFLAACTCAAQTTGKSAAESAWANDLKNYPGLSEELGKLFTRLQKEVQPPPIRRQSELLPLLPESTLYYAALPNYGNATHQSLQIFHEELQNSQVLRDWWQHGELAKSSPWLESTIEKVDEFSQYIGDEIVVAGGGTGPEHTVVAIARVRKPGFKDFLQQMLRQIPSKSKPTLRVIDLQELAVAKDDAAGNGAVIVVRPDFVIAAPSVNAARNFNSLIERKAGRFASTAFGMRLLQAYTDGASALAGADLEQLLKQVPPGTMKDPEMFQRTGFADVKYLIWEHKSGEGKTASQAELSFTGPRHGLASWLAAPAPLNSLGFVSSNAVLAFTLKLKNLSEIFADVRELATESNPNAWASIDQMQQAMNLNLKRDLLSHFGGEITLELDTIAQPNPDWKAILQVNDSQGLQSTLSRLLATSPFPAEQSEEGGITYHVLRIPSRTKPLEIACAFVDGYMIIASSRENLAQAVQFHNSGGSLISSAKFQAAVPSGGTASASAMFYEDPVAMSSLWLKQASPELADTLSRLRGNAPLTIWGYGDESALREVSTSSGADAAGVMIGAAIAIPNLLRARIAANESAAVATLRTLNTAQVTYSATYPQRGFARDMASLGADPRSINLLSAQHANLISSDLGNVTCASDSWCTKSGFRFTIKAFCQQTKCRDYVAVATPAGNGTGTRNFCSTSDGVIRFQQGEPLNQPISANQCKGWQPLR